MRLFLLAAASGIALGAAVPASAQPYDYGYAEPIAQPIPIDRALAERCGFYAGAVRPHELGAYRAAYRRGDDGLGGALIGGVVGGVVGNRIAGHGDRTLGTVAGAAVGAVAGAAIDRSEDRGPEPRLVEPGAAYAGECEAAFPPGYRLVAVAGAPDCHDEVVTHEEWVPEYVTVPGTPRRAAPLRDKRTKLRRVN